jgi:hypothetical protein
MFLSFSKTSIFFWLNLYCLAKPLYFHYENKGSFATQLQLNQNNSFSIIIQLHYNYTHDVMPMSIIIIHLIKSNTWHYEDFLT